jgi:processing peptidase subunit beta
LAKPWEDVDAEPQVAYDHAMLNTPETKVTTLANGFRVVTEQTPHQTAAVAVHVDAGSRFENAKNNGSAFVF